MFSLKAVGLKIAMKLARAELASRIDGKSEAEIAGMVRGLAKSVIDDISDEKLTGKAKKALAWLDEKIETKE